MAGGRLVLSSLMSTQMLSFGALHRQTLLPTSNDRICKLFNQNQDLEVRHLGRNRFPFPLFCISHPLLPHAVLHLPAKPAYIVGFPDHIPSFLTPAALRSCSKESWCDKTVTLPVGEGGLHSAFPIWCFKKLRIICKIVTWSLWSGNPCRENG